eukprot:5859172-Pyramimonas_sp.AAC.1
MHGLNEWRLHTIRVERYLSEGSATDMRMDMLPVTCKLSETLQYDGFIISLDVGWLFDRATQ